MSEINIKKLSKKSSVPVLTSSPKHTSSDETSKASKLKKSTCAEKSELMVLYLSLITFKTLKIL
jgi:hypothetical protein